MALFILFTTFIFAQSNLPIGLQKIIEYNQKVSNDFAMKISFFIAFIAGMLGILSPCLFPFLPAYFSYTFKEKKNITWMTFIFFLGFSLVFVAMGVIAGFIGEQTLIVLQKAWLVMIAGVVMIILGLVVLRGKSVCSYMDNKCKDDRPGVFIFGITFALGWTACLGPILAGILSMAVILGNVWYSGLLMFFYALGNFVPFFIISMFYDKFNLAESKFIQGRILSFNIFGKDVHVHSSNLISGILFILIGLVLVIFRGTALFNAWDIFGTKEYFYSIQGVLLDWQYANLVGGIVLLVFVLGVSWFLWKNKKKSVVNE
ncbi:MAG: cytochrome c biogenesis CcdA family protein [Candidatus Woesearchaeota archaeon]|nr:cytochrome c biogenesis CcdA family protein [Candidatus Woesearchaeota archaeon]